MVLVPPPLQVRNRNGGKLCLWATGSTEYRRAGTVVGQGEGPGGNLSRVGEPMREINGIYRFRVRYSEADQMGITYYANYLDWFTIGRTELLRNLGLPYAELERNGMLLPVLEARCRYLSPTAYDDPVRLETTMTRCTRTRMSFRYRVVVEENPERLAAEGETEHAFIDRNYRPMDLKKRFPEVWERLAELSQVIGS